LFMGHFKRFNLPVVEDLGAETAADLESSVPEEVSPEQTSEDLGPSAQEEVAHEQVSISPPVSPTVSGSKEEEQLQEKEAVVKDKEVDSSKTAEEKKHLSLARDTAQTVQQFLSKETLEIDEPELLKGPFDFDSLSPVQTMKIASFANAKANEKLLKSHMEDCELIEAASGVLVKIMPSIQIDPTASTSGNLKTLVSSVDTHFDSLEKSAEEKVRKEFLDKRFSEILELISKDRKIVSIGIKSLENALKDGGDIYKFCISWSKATAAFDKKIKEEQDKLQSLSQSFDPLSSSIINQECQTIAVLNEIKNLEKERKNITNRMGELRRIIIPKLETMHEAISDAQTTAQTKDPTDLKRAEAFAFLLSGHISILDRMKQSWATEMIQLQTSFADILQYM